MARTKRDPNALDKRNLITRTITHAEYTIRVLPEGSDTVITHHEKTAMNDQSARTAFRRMYKAEGQIISITRGESVEKLLYQTLDEFIASAHEWTGSEPEPANESEPEPANESESDTKEGNK